MKVSKKQSPAGRRRDSSPFKEAIQKLDEAIKLFGGKDKKKALEAFQAIVDHFPDERTIADRCRTYILICKRSMSPIAGPLTSAEDYYVRGSWHMNKGDLEHALEDFLAAMKIDSRSDHIHYTLAAAYARKGDAEAAAKYLEKAIEINADNREFVLNDADFIEIFNTPAIEAVLERYPPTT